ncbi:HSF-type DNA-binding-domain-containing protein [Glomus cerebriforme]|uniref:Transcription factor n=1 Tax=Glomus cerebriforme TaxID=658196 RepID=A0A397TCP5_9GLOM|nr:HSF-type DNA-binding-domain-containing protein [Glomus cerebriforme]
MSNTGGPDFVKKLFKMLEDESYSDIVSWGINGDSFVVKEIDAFTKTILPRHFKHSNFASFVRQLNKYDFHKIRNSDDSNSPYGEQAWEFHHPKFQCDKRDQLDNIKRKTPANQKKIASIAVNDGSNMTHLTELQSQVNNLTKLQTNMNEHLHALSKNYHSVVQDLLNFQKNMVAQDQLMQNLVQYLVNLEAEKSGSYNGGHHSGASGENIPTPFIPSDQAQKLINSYTEVARASFDQMNEISRRAQSIHHIASTCNIKNSSTSLSDSGSNTSNESLEFNTQLPLRSNLSDNNIGNINTSTSSESALPKNYISSQSISAAETINISNGYSSNNVSDTMINLHPSDNGLTVLTVGHLTPRQSQSSSTTNLLPVAISNNNSNSSIPHIDNTSPQRASNTMRVHRSTFVPAWSVPPKVLLVDDDAVYQNIGSKFLQVFGCAIDIAVDGISAVNKMNFERYDLVLMDIVLPNLDGVEATTQIRRFDPNTPIISMTSNTTTQECIKYLSHGMNDILAKPFTKANLLSMLERYCMHLKVMPNFQNIPRPLGTADRPTTTMSNNNLISTDDNLNENWMSNQMPLVMSGDNAYSSGPSFTVMSGDNYMQMMSNVVNTSNGARYLEDNDDNQNQRPRKKPKFELVE